MNIFTNWVSNIYKDIGLNTYYFFDYIDPKLLEKKINYK